MPRRHTDLRIRPSRTLRLGVVPIAYMAERASLGAFMTAHPMLKIFFGPLVEPWIKSK